MATCQPTVHYVYLLSLQIVAYTAFKVNDGF